MTGFVDYPEDFTTITIPFTTHAASGALVAPSSALEAADVKIFKNGSATEKTTTNGLTMTSSFNGTVGSHMLVIDSSNDTGDVGFWVAGAVYDVFLEPDETVDGIAVGKWVGKFGLDLSSALRPLTLGRKLDVTAANKVNGVVLVDTLTTYTGDTPQTGDSFARIGATGSGLTSLAPSATALSTVQWTNVRAGLLDNLDALITSRLAAAGYTAPDNASIAAILVDTGTTLDGKVDSIISAIAALNNVTANQVRDAVFSRAFSAAYGGFTFDELTKLMVAVLLAKVSGMDTNSPAFRNLADNANVVVATTDADGNRSAVTLTP